MSYLALYRAFRPTSFDSLIGQEHVVKTLENQIKTGRIGHAYLFCGARGTGKTTAAKIFAKAINCLSPVNGSPCGECEVCKKLENPSNLDILEMDAASNNKVENVRELRDKIQYPPVAGRYKVYIVDEVHMLTTEAFNALLKTLEEPPEHAVFILATTEAHKLPSTILSRCMRFDFKLVPTEKIAELIREVYDKIGKKYEHEAIELIAKAGEGSVRDALSVADVCVSYGEGVLTYNDVLEVLGTSDRECVEKLVAGIFAGDCGAVLSSVETLCGKGKSAGVLNRDVCSCLRDLLVAKTCDNAEKLLGLPKDKFEEFKALAARGTVNGILRTIEIFSAAEADLKYSTHPKIVFETAAVKASMPQADYNIDALLSRMTKIEAQLNELKNGGMITAVPAITEQKPAYKPVGGGLAGVEQGLDTASSNGNFSATSENNEKKSLNEETSVFSKTNTIVENEKPAYKSIIDGFASASVEEKAENAIEKNEKKSAAKPVVNNAAEDITDVKRFWGSVLRQMRADKAIMLWVACQDVTAIARGSEIIVCAAGDNEYNLLTKPENSKKLEEYLLAAGASGMQIVRSVDETVNIGKGDCEADAKAAVEAETEKVRKFMGDDVEIVD